ncbi:MAG: Ig-like domain-containing protein [Limisphaerales bacterium]
MTNLNDSGPGSYRAAIEASGPRTVVFDVSGIIWLQSPCIIGNGYVTIAGQTAPGDGICIANFRAGCGGPNDVIMRFMHFRVGDHEEQSMDAMSPGSATYGIFDHLTSSWSLDVACNSLQSGGVGSGSAMTSYQHNIISEPLRYSYHYNDSERAATGCTNCYQPHAFAASISGEIGSYHHNLITHSTDRNWSLAGGLDQSVHYAGSLDIRNNVVYNWTARTTDGGVARLDYVNNYYKPYMANHPVTWLLKLDSINTNWGTEYIYMSGNVMQGEPYYSNNWMGGSFVNGLPLNGLVVTNTEIFPSCVTTQTASNAYEVVLSDVGCNEPREDLIDQRTIGEVLDGSTHYEGTNGPNYTINGVLQDDRGPDNPGFIDSQTDVHDYQSTNSALSNYSPNAPWPPYYTCNVPIDSDHDGLPDWWELLHGTNPNSPAGDFSDDNADPDGDGYTDLEDYLNWLAGIHLDCDRNGYVDVDLTQYTRGFTNNLPVYAVSNSTNGAVALLAGGSVARFTPSAGFHGLGAFQFVVTDGSGFSYTNNIGIHVWANPQSHLACSLLDAVPQLRFTGEAGFYYLLQYSDDLAHWTTWTHVTATASAQTFVPPGYPNPSVRFYRAISVE